MWQSDFASLSDAPEKDNPLGPEAREISKSEKCDFSKFYKNVEPFVLIKHKKENMQHTMTYDRVITSNERFHELHARKKAV